MYYHNQKKRYRDAVYLALNWGICFSTVSALDTFYVKYLKKLGQYEKFTLIYNIFFLQPNIFSYKFLTKDQNQPSLHFRYMPLYTAGTLQFI